MSERKGDATCMFITFQIYLPPTQFLILCSQHIISESVLDLSKYSWLLKSIHNVYYIVH